MSNPEEYLNRSAPKEVLIDLDGYQIAAKRWGDEQGPPVLALHGWLDNAATYDRLAPLLPNLNLLALDLPGHGYSDPLPISSHYHFIDSIPLIDHVLQTLDWERCYLLGHSLGAAIATLVAAVLGDRISKLALLEGLGPITESSPQETPKRVAQYLKEITSLKKKSPPVYPDVQGAAQVRQGVGDLSPIGAQTLAFRGTKRVPGGVTWRSDPRIKTTSMIRLSEPQVSAFLEQITCPTLLIKAKRGLLASKRLAEGVEKREKQVKNLSVEVVDGGHHVHLDHPDRVAPILSNFLKPLS